VLLDRQRRSPLCFKNRTETVSHVTTADRAAFVQSWCQPEQTQKVRFNVWWVELKMGDATSVRKFEAKVRFLIECKRYAPSHKVGVELVRALYGVRMHEKATKGILATTSTFTRGAKAFFNDHLWELEPRDFDGVVDWVKLATKNVKDV
jgi:restriction endonuclease